MDDLNFDTASSKLTKERTSTEMVNFSYVMGIYYDCELSVFTEGESLTALSASKTV
jgi:hypothetical protein